MRLRKAYLNDKHELDTLIRNNINNDSVWCLDINYDIDALIASNITFSSPNHTQCIIFKDMLVGFIQYFGFDKDEESINMGFLIDKHFQRQGIMTKACSQSLKSLLADKNIREVKAYVDFNNIASKKLLEKLNFRVIKCRQFDNKKIDLYINSFFN
jgi:RimJ/RimL family protein N-acetyltransferase